MDLTEERDEDTVYVKLDGGVVFEWYDDAHIDVPEDLTWFRSISEVFYAGVRVGETLAKGEIK